MPEQTADGARINGWLNVAYTIGVTSSDCTRRQVGAVLVVNNLEVIATGFNRNPPALGRCDAGGCPRGRLSHSELPTGAPYEGNCSALHAEDAALRSFLWDRARTFPRLSVRLKEASPGWLTAIHPDAEMFVSSEPCGQCRPLLENSGVRFYYPGSW